MIKEGDSVPSFALKNSHGDVIKSTDLEGKKHVIYFYTNDFNEGCTIEATEFTKNYKKLQKAGIEIIGISRNDVDSHKDFCDELNIPYILLADIDCEVAKKFGVAYTKEFLGNELTLALRSTFLINEKGKIFKVFKEVEPAGHSQQVIEAFKSN